MEAAAYINDVIERTPSRPAGPTVKKANQSYRELVAFQRAVRRKSLKHFKEVFDAADQAKQAKAE